MTKEMPTTHQTTQVSIVGACQRVVPALSGLWLRWVGIPDLHNASFEIWHPTEGNHISGSSKIDLHAGPTYMETRTQLCDLLGLAPEDEQRRTASILLPGNSPAHQTFWATLRAREQEVEGPTEFWWAMLQLRHRGLKGASRVLGGALFPQLADHLGGALISFENPTIRPGVRAYEELLVSGQYRQPEVLRLCLPERTIRVCLTEQKRQGVQQQLIDLAVSVQEEE